MKPNIGDKLIGDDSWCELVGIKGENLILVWDDGFRGEYTPGTRAYRLFHGEEITEGSLRYHRGVRSTVINFYEGV